jgi:hypothetical protein
MNRVSFYQLEDKKKLMIRGLSEMRPFMAQQNSGNVERVNS